MACSQTNTTNTCGNPCGSHHRGSGYLLLIVLYILLAIIVGSYIC